MAFGHGFTGLLVASIISFTSGIAFIICFREFIREVFARMTPVKFEKTLRRNRYILLDRGAEFVVDDEVFSELVKDRNMAQSAMRREWNDPTTYMITLGFLGAVAAAGFIAGISHFS